MSLRRKEPQLDGKLGSPLVTWLDQDKLEDVLGDVFEVTLRRCRWASLSS